MPQSFNISIEPCKEAIYHLEDQKAWLMLAEIGKRLKECYPEFKPTFNPLSCIGTHIESIVKQFSEYREVQFWLMADRDDWWGLKAVHETLSHRDTNMGIELEFLERKPELLEGYSLAHASMAHIGYGNLNMEWYDRELEHVAECVDYSREDTPEDDYQYYKMAEDRYINEDSTYQKIVSTKEDLYKLNTIRTKDKELEKWFRHIVDCRKRNLFLCDFILETPDDEAWLDPSELLGLIYDGSDGVWEGVNQMINDTWGNASYPTDFEHGELINAAYHTINKKEDFEELMDLLQEGSKVTYKYYDLCTLK